jgi:hypothetical protein
MKKLRLTGLKINEKNGEIILLGTPDIKKEELSNFKYLAIGNSIVKIEEIQVTKKYDKIGFLIRLNKYINIDEKEGVICVGEWCVKKDNYIGVLTDEGLQEFNKKINEQEQTTQEIKAPNTLSEEDKLRLAVQQSQESNTPFWKTKKVKLAIIIGLGIVVLFIFRKPIMKFMKSMFSPNKPNTIDTNAEVIETSELSGNPEVEPTEILDPDIANAGKGLLDEEI